MPTRAPVMRICMTGWKQITQWKCQLLEGAVGVFGGEAKAETPTVDLKSLHAKIGELTLENDFSEGALTKAGVPGELARWGGRRVC